MLPSQASVVVAGGGPAGYMAAIAAAEAGATDLLILEATPEPLHKVRISGGGRCNVTHACWDPRALVGHYPRGGQALRGPFSRFATGDAVTWFAEHGLELVEEADGRLFPRSNRSSSVVDTLRQAARRAGVLTVEGQALQAAVPLAGGGFRLSLRGGGTLEADRLVLATGSHPSGLRIAEALGHGRVPPVPSLFTLALEPHPLAALAGVVADPVVLELEAPSAHGEASEGRQRGERHRQRGLCWSPTGASAVLPPSASPPSLPAIFASGAIAPSSGLIGPEASILRSWRRVSGPPGWSWPVGNWPRRVPGLRWDAVSGSISSRGVEWMEPSAGLIWGGTSSAT